MSHDPFLPRWAWTVALCIAALTVAAAVAAQPAAKVHRIGVLGNQNNPHWEGLRQGLRELGYVEGRNIVMDWRWSDGVPERLPALARELVSLNPDLIVASGTQAVQAAQMATRTIPIVMALSQEPEKLGLVESLARPGGNITGLSTYSPQLMAKKFELLREIAPGISRVGFVWDPTAQGQQLQFQRLPAAAVGLSIRSIEVRRPEEMPAALASVTWGHGDALLAIGNPVTFKSREAIAEFALRNGLPSVFEERLFVAAGGLLSYGPSFIDLFRRTADFVDRILRGARPADLPVEQPIKFELVVNLKTARALGLTIPSSVLLRATEVIE